MAKKTEETEKAKKAKEEGKAETAEGAVKTKAEEKKETVEITEKIEKVSAKEQKGDKKYQNPFLFTDPLQSKFINCIMHCGKKTLAQRILRDTFEEMHRRGAKDALKVFEKAIQNATPVMEVRPKRIGGAVYQIPIEVGTKRQQSLSVRWLLAGARSRKGQPMYKRLATELMDAANEQGFAFNKKEESHRAAQANKAFAHLARY